MSVPRLELDFVRPRARGGIAGIVAVFIGGLSLAGACYQYHALTAQRAGLQLRQAALSKIHGTGPVAEPFTGLGTQNSDKTLRELGTPWSQLLGELEAASSDTSGNVALLSIEPDHAKHRVRVTAEARTLELALAYVQRLRKTPVLRYPMLDSHEVQSDDKDHPVRFKISADWGDAS